MDNDFDLAFAPLGILFGYLYCYIKFNELTKLREYIKNHFPGYRIRNYLTPYFHPEENKIRLLFVIPPVIIFVALLLFNIYYIVNPIEGVQMAPMTFSRVIVYVIVSIIFLITVFQIFDLVDELKYIELRLPFRSRKSEKSVDVKLHNNEIILSLLTFLGFGIFFFILTLFLNLEHSARAAFFVVSSFSIGISLFYVKMFHWK